MELLPKYYSYILDFTVLPKDTIFDYIPNLPKLSLVFVKVFSFERASL